jgi:acetylornithine deacetylase/succinyl-diaminopimelate desuccinylase-like protein
VNGASAAIDWDRPTETLVSTLRDLIRIPSVNPPSPEAPGEELRAARYLAGILQAAGLTPEVVEPVPGRGSVHVRLRGDGTGGEPLLLLSHLDVVPAPPERWTHAPFEAALADGYVYGRGAVDMKAMVAMELAVVLQLVAEARAAGLDPAADAIPGLRRDLLFTCTADEEAGGLDGAAWVVANRPQWIAAAGALNECGAVSATVAGTRFYPIGVAEKGYAAYRIHVRGTWGHGSMPREDNAAVLAAAVISRLVEPEPTRLTPVMTRFLEAAAKNLPADAARVARAMATGDAALTAATLDGLCDARDARALRALLRDTISPDVVHAGVKYNVIPGDAVIEVDCRVLPGTDEAGMRARLMERIGPELAGACTVELIVYGEPVDAPAEGPLFEIMMATIRDHDPDGVPLPVMVPFATDAKHTALLGVPTYGFSPLRLDGDERLLDRFHGVDERVGVAALRWGLPVLYDVVRRFCG